MHPNNIILIFLLLVSGPFLYGQCVQDCGSSTRYGNQTGFDNMGSSLTAFGNLAGFNNDGDRNSVFGEGAGRSNTGGSDNSFYGYQTGHDNTTGGNNSFFGRESGYYNTKGDNNSFFGTASGAINTEGGSNSFFGVDSGRNNVSGSHNVAIGYRAGSANGTTDIDSTLYIDVMSTNEPLIYGQFNKRIVRINGSFEAMGGVSNSSDINRKEAILPIDELEILEKVSELELSEWSYKDASDIRHLGPMAQDFYEQFGLGESEKTIGTLDADGVALASIQALYQLWQDEKKRNDRLEKKVDELYQKMEEHIEK